MILNFLFPDSDKKCRGLSNKTIDQKAMILIFALFAVDACIVYCLFQPVLGVDSAGRRSGHMITWVNGQVVVWPLREKYFSECAEIKLLLYFFLQRVLS